MYTYSDSLFDTPETKTTWLISYPPAKIKKKNTSLSYSYDTSHWLKVKVSAELVPLWRRGEDPLFCLSQLLEAAHVPRLVFPFFCLQHLIHVTSPCPVFQGQTSFLP